MVERALLRGRVHFAWGRHLRAAVKSRPPRHRSSHGTSVGRSTQEEITSAGRRCRKPAQGRDRREEGATHPRSVRRTAEDFGRDRTLQASVTAKPDHPPSHDRSEEHTSELQSLMRTSYAVCCLKKKKTKYFTTHPNPHNTK